MSEQLQHDTGGEASHGPIHIGDTIVDAKPPGMSERPLPQGRLSVEGIQAVRYDIAEIFGDTVDIMNNLHLPERTYAGTDREHLATTHDYPVEVDGKTMNVNIQGSGKDIVVLLAGRGVTAPSYDMAPLIDQLAGDSTVITVDFFGTGLSDMTDTPRTPVTIAHEVHEALSKLGAKNYSLVGHSISGIYGLQFANMFPSEVQSFVGIDTAVPKMDELLSEYNPELAGDTPVDETRDDQTDEQCIRKEVEAVVGHTYTEQEIERMIALETRNKANDAVFEEIKKRAGETTEKPYNSMRFPDTMPVAFFLSNESVGMAPAWYRQAHEEQLTQADGCSVMVLPGEHFLHHTQAAAIARGVHLLRTAKF